MRVAAAAVITLAVSTAALAQTLTVGQLAVETTGSLSITPPYSVLDFSSPATKTGTVNWVSVQWSATKACGDFKIKFMRPNISRTSTTLVAERGPFLPNIGMTSVQLNPGVAVQKGDLIAISAPAN